jgi:hypothetical protein
MRQYIMNAFHSNLTDVGLNRHRRGLPPSELQIYDPDLSPTFPSGILHFAIVARPSLILNKLPTIQILSYSIHEPGYKKP